MVEFFLSLLAGFSLNANPGETQVPKLGQPLVYESFDSDVDITLTVVPIEITGRSLALLGFSSGAPQPLDQVWIYQPSSKSHKRTSYRLLGTDWTVMNTRQKRVLVKGSLRDAAEAYIFSGRTPVRLLYSKELSRKADPNSLWSAYQAQAVPVPPGDTGRVEQAFRTAATDLSKACRSARTPVVQIDWQAFESGQARDAVVSGLHYLAVLSGMCARDEDYREAIRAYREIKLDLSSDAQLHQLFVRGSSLRISLAADMPNTCLYAQKWFTDNL